MFETINLDSKLKFEQTVQMTAFVIPIRLNDVLFLNLLSENLIMMSYRYINELKQGLSLGDLKHLVYIIKHRI